MTYDAVIVGGGVSGLSCAWRLISQGVSTSAVRVLERAPHTGGHLQTERYREFVIDQGPNGFLDSAPDTLALVGELGLEKQMQQSHEAAARRFIYRGGTLREVTTHPLRFLFGGLLPLPAALRICGEPFVPRGGHPHETVLDFASRRIGPTGASILVDAMVGGVFAGTARTLELASAFPKMAAMEAAHGSLFKAMLARRKQARPRGGPTGPAGRLTSFNGGIHTLIRTLTDQLGPVVQTDSGVRYVHATPDGYAITLDTGAIIRSRTVVLATPAWATAQLVTALSPDLAATLEQIDYPPVTVIASAIPQSSTWSPPSGFGFLVPGTEDQHILGCLWTSAIWSHRAPEGYALLRTMVGGTRQPHIAHLDDASLVDIVTRQLQAIMGPMPSAAFHRIYRHPRAIAQYTVGHGDRLNRIDALCAAHPGLYLTGNAYRGISLNHCIHDTRRIADTLRHTHLSPLHVYS